MLLQVVLVYDGFSLVRTFAGYSERAWPAWKLEWQLRRHILPALERSDPDEALRRLDDVSAEARLFEDRVVPVRIEAFLAKDDVPRALHEYQRFLELSGDVDLPHWIHDVLDPQLPVGDGPATRIHFADETVLRGAGFTHRQRSGARLEALYQAMGSGLAAVDLDGDDDLDLLFLGGTEAANDEPGNRLLRNLGNGYFEDVTAASGLGDTGFSYGVAGADLTGDGLPELFVTALGPNHLFRNLGEMRFEDITSRAGVGGDGGASTGATFGDLDGDGDLDLYVAQWVRDAKGPADGIVRLVFGDRSRLALFAPHMYSPAENQLFRNEGDGTFRDITAEAGVADPDGRGLGVTWVDFDGDTRPDLFVANDESPNRFFRNLGGGRFEDASTRVRLYDARAGMGVAVADLDGNAAPDLIYTNFRTEYNAAVINRLVDGHFSESTRDLGLAEGALGVTSWGVAAEDFDNDGDADLAMVNGHPTPFDPGVTPFRGDLAERERCLPEPPLVYERSGDRYRNVTAGTGAPASVEDVGRGLVAGDLDRDGQLDLVVSTNQGPSYLWRNVSPDTEHWLVVQPRGGPDNRLGIGATVTLEGAPGTQRRVIVSGGSYLSQPPLEAHFGLGPAERVRRVIVRWPDGVESTVLDVEANQILRVERGEAPS